jgi:hypothetical protein
VVVSALRFIAGYLAGIGASSRPDQQPASRANGRTGPRMTGSRSQECSGPHADSGPDDSTCGRILISNLLRGHAYLLFCPMPASHVFNLELLERLPWGREHHDRRAGRHGNASAYEQ